MTRRVDRIEHSIASVVTKIDTVLIKLEAMEKTKLRQQEDLNKLMQQHSAQQTPQAHPVRKKFDSIFSENDC